jgi:hypothetical protein
MAISFCDLLSLLHPSGAGPILMYKAYFDESIPKDRSIFSVGGFWGEASAWDGLQEEWLNLLPKGVDFHSTDCFWGAEQFDGMSSRERGKLLDNVTDLIVSRQLSLVIACMDLSAYKKKAPNSMENDFLTNRYIACLDSVVCYSCNRSGPNPLLGRPDVEDDNCAFTMEDNQYTPFLSPYFFQARNNRKLWWSSRVGVHAYGTKKHIPLLQVADLGAYLGTKAVMEAAEDETPIPWKQYYDKLASAGRIGIRSLITGESQDRLYATHEWLMRPTST